MENQLTTTVYDKHKLTDSDRNTIISDMTDALICKFEEIRTFIIDDTVNAFKRKYRLGQMISEVTNDEKKYGQSAVKQMSALLGMNSDTLYGARLFAERYSEAELDELVNARNKNGDVLTWNHVAQLARVEDHDNRESLQRQALNNNWTPLELADHVQQLKGGKLSKGGRPLARPDNLNGLLTQMDAMTGKWLKCYNEIWIGGSKLLVTMSNNLENADIKLLNMLQEMEDKANDATAAAEVLAKEIKKIRLDLCSNSKGGEYLPFKSRLPIEPTIE